MNKKGFTLVELLAVLVILSLIAAISITAVSNGLDRYRTNLYNTQKNNITAAARMWAVDHKELLPTSNPTETTDVCTYKSTCPNEYSVITVTLNQLQDEGYIDKNIKDIKNQESFENVRIKIKKVENSKEYEYEYISKIYVAYSVGDEVAIKVRSDYSTDFIIIENSSTDDSTVRAIMKNNYATSTWCDSASCDSPYILLSSMPKNWDYTSSAVTILNKDEANSLRQTINLGTDQFWTSSEYPGDSAQAFYYMGSTGLSPKSKTDTSGVRPVITISKQYIEY